MAEAPHTAKHSLAFVCSTQEVQINILDEFCRKCVRIKFISTPFECVEKRDGTALEGRRRWNYITIYSKTGICIWNGIFSVINFFLVSLFQVAMFLCASASKPPNNQHNKFSIQLGNCDEKPHIIQYTYLFTFKHIPAIFNKIKF